MDTDAFDLNDVFTNAPVDEETLKQDEKLKKRIEKRSKMDREEQRRINREKRQLKKEAREKNKKRKRGEEVSDDEEEAEKKEGDKEEKDTKKQKTAKKEKVVEYGVWVGNLAFRTTREQITKFFSDCGTVTRLKCPKGQGKNNNNKGFAYVMFATKEEADKAVAKSEQKIDARALLIKPADNFERKDGLTVKEVKKQKNPPCATLFIGNLPFDATKEGLREAFDECGDIMNVRLGTFEDTGKCKGFGYVDFETVEDATKAIRATNKHVLNGQKLRVEFGSEEAYKRGRPWLGRADKRAAEKPSGGYKERRQYNEEAPAANENYEKPRYERREKRIKNEKKPSSNQRVAPGMALSQAQRQKPTVQAFQGTKVTFD
ncbi:hypothetical protein BJV82DRAFT_581358 [Fennellomyces sp. T-0311]|nr:hypothetical protein BJV82DRAFT_581358 [Fennellomyces sp. T-0311]